MAWMVTGGSGMLASDVKRELDRRGILHDAPGHGELDIVSPAEVDAYLDRTQPEVVVNCAAYTAVDAAEEDEAAAFATNATGASNLARATAARSIPLVQVSTDYVFPGDADTPYGEDAPLGPLGAYGRTKAAGEWAVQGQNPSSYIVRTAWLYGASGGCFPKTMARVLRENGKAGVVDDQRGQPTWTADVARIIVDLVASGAPYGIYHATSGGDGTWFDFTKEIAKSVGMSPDAVHPVSTADFPRPAPRPSWSVLGHDAFSGTEVEPIGDWKERWERASAEVLADVE